MQRGKPRSALFGGALLVALGVLAQPVMADSPATAVAGHATLSGGAVVTVAAFERDGEARGHLRVSSAPGFLYVSEVRCIRVVGSRVLVGGVIVEATIPETIGATSLIGVEDRGPRESDRLGIAFSTSGLDTCPAFPLPMHAVERGNFAVG